MLARKENFRCHSFDIACAPLDIEPRLTRPNPPWTDGQVERMNRTLKEATVRRYYSANHDQLREHLQTIVAA
ncbi:MAG: transposase [Alphaproteobacteria bacterium]|jgi:transposase|nr:transposase [Alphaproteobacteria bacterium]